MEFRKAWYCDIYGRDPYGHPIFVHRMGANRPGVAVTLLKTWRVQTDASRGEFLMTLLPLTRCYQAENHHKEVQDGGNRGPGMSAWKQHPAFARWPR